MKPPTLAHLLTGSRAFGVASKHSDWDYLGMGPVVDRSLSERFLCRTNGWVKVVYSDCNWTVWRRGLANIIVAHSMDAMERWHRAHHHCMVERPRSKDRRKVIFDHYLYDMPLHRKKPLPKYLRRLYPLVRKAEVKRGSHG